MTTFTVEINGDGNYDIFADDVWVATVATESEADGLLSYLER